MENWHKVLLVIFLLIAGYAGLYVYSLSKVEIRTVTFDSIQDISLRGFTVSGYVEVYNGGIIEVSMDHIEYDIIFENSGQNLGSGVVEGKSLPPGETIRFPLSNKINWIPTAEIVKSLIDKGNTYIVVKGTVHVADLGFIDFKLPFEKRINLEDYLRQFVVNKINDAVDKATDVIKNTVDAVSEGIKSVTGNIVKGIEGLLG